MTTAKTTTRKEANGDSHDTPSPELMHTAYQIHTLAQIVRGQIATAHPWVTSVIPPTGPEPTTAWMPSMMAGPVTAWGATTPWPW